MDFIINYPSGFFLFTPFIASYRHFKIAFAKDTQIVKLETSTIIADSQKLPKTAKITCKERFKHLSLGCLESFGLIAIPLPWVVYAIEKQFNQQVKKKKIEPELNDSIIETTNAKRRTSTSFDTTIDLHQKVIDYLQHHKPSNAFEWVLQNSTFPQDHDPNQMIYEAYLRRHEQEIGNTLQVNAILSAYLSKRADVGCLSPQGLSMENQSQKPRFYYTPVHQISQNIEDVQVHLFILLHNEMCYHPQHRPEKIIIPMNWRKDHLCHSTFMIIEPSSQEIKEARITMVNNNGDHPATFLAYENAAIQAAKDVYSSPKTTAVRNQNSIYTTAYSCTRDTVRLIRDLIDEPNAQEKVRRGLQRMALSEDEKHRLENGVEMMLFYQKYL